MEKKITATEFMQQNTIPKRSKLTPFQDDILLLKQNGYTDSQVLEFLAMNGVRVAQSTLNEFIKRKTRNQTVQPAKNNVSHTQITPPPPTNTEIPQNQAENAPVRRGLRKPTPTRKFNWDERPDPETLK
ncbi:hypothetical protein [Kingella negevensis]|uniref:Uncharacterized protein n=1 Tax=Kingella negevensis TaxID=1522312 RepID=A0A238TAM1_9NEIS|nr:hypothetical protein [Kingella negevensis]MDK4680037.1 hypothetical protein [Kingella negevensis]MDK4682243.1 hypothetical protein [Kingella negevensis]MDK4684814.1 hypothetical protein [Kingella negevensis]MDK4688264.1 hypothetical protein [Kingella negevensis]MDK4690440.1 hypothetical protein [Kingella negevensis]